MKRNLLIILLFSLLTLSFTGCHNNKTDENVVKIGAILPLTGNNSGLGQSIKAGLELAVKELNEQNADLKYDLVFEDVAEQKDVLAAYNKIKIANHASFYVTTGSAYSMALKPQVIKDGNIIFCIASLPEITENGEYNMFKVGNSSIDESLEITKYLNKISGQKNMLFYSNGEYGIPFYSTITANSNIVTSVIYDENDNNYKNVVAKNLSQTPDNIVVIGLTASMGMLIKTIRDYGYLGNIIANTCFNNEDVLSTAGNAKNGVMFLDYDIKKSSITQKRNDFIMEKCNMSFSSFNFLAFSIPYIINEAKDILTSSNVELVSNKIREQKELNIANEYLFTVEKNGDIKPTLTLKTF